MTSILPTFHAPDLFTGLSDYSRTIAEEIRTNAQARLSRYGLGTIQVALSGNLKLPFTLTGGTPAERTVTTKLLAD